MGKNKTTKLAAPSGFLAKRGLLSFVSVLVVAVLTACGGGSSADTSPRVGITSVKVFGDSLADVGVFKGLPAYGRIFSVQDSDTEPNTVWTERIAKAYGLTAPAGGAGAGAAQCNVYKNVGATFSDNSVAGCTNYAVGGGRIVNPSGKGGENLPLSVIAQMKKAALIGYSANDLVLINVGGNDAADLVVAFLKAAPPSNDGGAAFAELVSSLGVTPSADFKATGVAYMKALADKFVTSIEANVLTQGAPRVVVLNLPAILNTPRFQMVLKAGAAPYEPMFAAWFEAFNAQLAAKFADRTNVVVVDFYTNFNAQVANPAQYGLNNVKDPACPVTGVDASGLPEYNFQTCTAAALSAMKPSTPDWWKNYAFSDGFHPTPYGHQLLAQLVSLELAKKGWL